METQQTAPAARPKFSLSFFFLSLGTLISLTTAVVSFLNLVFGTLDKRLPDPLYGTYQYGYNTYDYEGIRMALATLIIFFPVFLVVSHFWKKASRRGLGSADALVRRWLIYIVLFASSLTVAIDLVTLVRYFVSGEITARFIWKVAATLLVMVFVGWYYLFELRGREKFLGMRIGWWPGVKASVLTAALIIWSFSVIGTPGMQRMWQLDSRRTSDLQGIQWQVISYWQQKEKLPASLADLQNPLSGYSLPVDPEFDKGKTYEYVPTGEKSFQLCATFSAPMPQGWVENGGPIAVPIAYQGGTVSSSPAMPPGSGMNESWDHQAGHTCFDRTIDPDLYPPYPKPAAAPAAE